MAQIVRIALILLVALAASSLALAKYRPDQDIYITVDIEVLEQIAEKMGVSEIGAKAFDEQEGAHATVTDTSGQEVDHYYIWFCAGDQCIPVDPFTASN